jgi:hypothetical protein
MTERPGPPGVPAGSSPGGSVGGTRTDPDDREAVRLREGLAARDPRVRAEWIARASPGPGVVGALEGAMDDPYPGVRIAAARALARIGSARSAPRLIRASSSDPSPDVRLEAVAAIGRLLEGRLRSAEGSPGPTVPSPGAGGERSAPV